ncbi:MAG TPA: protein-L-isoaspartate O-methyltransferase, partial [Candidatus Kapabacteria bacterium]|nr:protein-L-isoaspartate O-methyltransferase [Candidatus Kapabacteria bacterium]
MQSTASHFSTERRQMIAFLRANGIVDEAVLRVMGELPREEFLDGHFSSRSYEDSALPIGSGQTISQPYTVAYMTQALNLKRG